MGYEDAGLDYGALTEESDLDDALYDVDDHPEEEIPEQLPEEDQQEPGGPIDEQAPVATVVDAEITEGVEPEPEVHQEEPEPALEAPRTIDPEGRPVVAVCGTGGGAGATTVAALLAYAAAAQNRGQVLLTEVGGPSASLSAYLGTTAKYSLGSAANAHRAGLFGTNGTRPFVAINDHLRLMAKPPDALDQAPVGEDAALRDLLIDAQEDHYATFVDCGRLEQEAERQVAAAATHIVWVSGGTTTQARQARAKISTLGFRGSRFNLLFVRSDTRGVPELDAQREFGIAAEDNGLALVVAPPVGDLVEQGLKTTATRAIEPLKASLGRILR